MRRCAECAVGIEGDWSRCPLCGAPAEGAAVPSPIPAVGLRFHRRRVLRVLFLTSIAVILGSFLAQLLFSRELGGIGAARSMWLGVAAMWLVVLTAVRKRRNLAKSTVYVIVLLSLICVYWDYLAGWNGWSLTYAVPILCASSAAGLLITVRVRRTEVGEHIVYSALVLVLGLAPVGFLLLGWVTNPVASVICGALCFVALLMLEAARGREARHELTKRLHL